MSDDHIEGAGKKLVGSIKEAIGKVTGDADLETEGSVEKAAGAKRSAAGSAKDAVRDDRKG